MRSKEEILALLDELDFVVADDLENDTLDFKVGVSNPKERANLIVDAVVCFANSKGGTLVLGVKDKLAQASRKHALVGILSDIDISKLQEQIYNKTDPHITPHVEFLEVPEGRLLLIHVDQGTSPPYTNSAGQGTRRVGKNCLPLTGSMMRDLRFLSESSDFSAKTIMDAELADLVSPAEMTRLRVLAEESRVSDDLLQQSDTEVLRSLRLVQNDKLTLAGLLLVGRRESIQKYATNHEWQYAKMQTDVDIEVQSKGSGTILAALEKLEDYIAASNPITTV